MHVIARAAAAGAATLALAAGSVALAGSASAESPQPRDKNVTVRQDVGPVNVRDEAKTSGAVDRTMQPGESTWGDCWLYGEEVTDNGVTSNIWIDTGDPPFDYEYVWAGNLQGDKYANLDPGDSC